MTGQAIFQTQSGLIKIPIKCLPPRVEIQKIGNNLDLGCETIGEVIEKEISIKNVGKLDGKISFRIGDLAESDLSFIFEDDHVIDDQKMILPAESDKNFRVIYEPKLAGVFEKTLEYVIFQNDQIILDETIKITGETIPIPTSLSIDNFDFKVCSLGFLYQEEFFIINNGSVSKSFQFSMGKELSEIIKIHPPNGYVQVWDSKFSILVHFRYQKLRQENYRVFRASEFSKI